MTSVTSYTKQIPLNNAYYRALYPLTSQNVSSLLFTPSGTTTAGTVSSMVGATFPGVINFSTSLFKDMGSQSVVNGSTFRRVQMVVDGLSATSGVGGSFTANDYDYLSFYILQGFGGVGTSAFTGGSLPFIRTG
jgi:hypothetical protein